MSWTRHLPVPLWKITVSLVSVGGVVWGIQVHRRTRATDSTRIQRLACLPDTFRQSRSISKIVNPENHPAVGDCRSITIEIPPQHQDVSDEVLLARFVKGFFGGVVISIERTILQILGVNMVHLSRAEIPTSFVQEQIWWRKQLADEKLPPLHSIIFGVFQVLDKQLFSVDKNLIEDPATESYVDFGFGSDRFIFAGAHRFSIVRLKQKSDGGRELVQIHYYSMSCNPTKNQPLKGGFMFWFHEMYGEYLFREGVSEVLSYTQGT